MTEAKLIGYIKLKQGELLGSSPLRTDGVHGSQAGGLTGCPVDENAQMRVGKQLQAAKGPDQKQQE